MSERMLEDMSERISQDLPERMLQDMLERMSKICQIEHQKKVRKNVRQEDRLKRV